MKKPLKPAQTQPGQLLSPADIITPRQLSERLQVRESWVFEKTRRRQRNPLPVFRIGKYLRFSWPAVVAWLERTQVTA